MHPVGRLDMDTMVCCYLAPTANSQTPFCIQVRGSIGSTKPSSQARREALTILDDGVKPPGTFRATLLESRFLTRKSLSQQFNCGEDEQEEGDEDGEAGTLKQTAPMSRCPCRKATSNGRRILHNSAGHSVINLHRVRYGGIHLNEIDEGEVRPITDDEHVGQQARVK